MIDVERVGDRIELRGWVGSTTPHKVNAVGGARFSKTGGKHWRLPLNMATCRRLREVFGPALRIGPELNAWAHAAKREEAALAALKDLSSPVELPCLRTYAPALHEAARPYQRAGIAFGARVGSFGNFDQPGLGKTAQAIGTVIERNREKRLYRHLILSPKIAAETVWPAEVAKWTLSDSQAFPLTGTRRNREKALSAALGVRTGHVFVCANIEMARIVPEPDPDPAAGRERWHADNRLRVRPSGGVLPAKDELGERQAVRYVMTGAVWPQLYDGIEWDTVILDESHRALVRKSVRSESQQRKGIVSLQTRDRIALSGTPMRGKPEQLWGTLNWLCPEVYSSYWTFVAQFYATESNGFSQHVITGFKPGGEERLARSIEHITLRRTKAEVLPELPPKTYAGWHLIPGDPDSPFGIWLPPSAKHQAQYDEFVSDASVEWEGEELLAIGPLAEYTRKCQLASAIHAVVGGTLMPTCDSVKYEWLLELCAELGIPDDGRLVVSSRFTRLINVFAAGLTTAGIPCHRLTGETSTRERQRIMDDFQSPDPSARVFFLNATAGGVAVTLDAADDLVLLDESPVPDDQEQVEDRVHRASRNHNVTIRYVRTLGTIEEELAWIAAARESVQKYILDGTRGVTYARNLYLTKKEHTNG